MKTFFSALLYATLVFSPVFSAAQATNAVAAAEIEHLLSYLGNSNCQFNRNGSWHSAIQTKKHLNSKYIDLLDKRSMVLTAEEFIDIVATQNSTGGKRFLVKCSDGAELDNAAWLTAELTRLRKEAK